MAKAKRAFHLHTFGNNNQINEKLSLNVPKNHSAPIFGYLNAMEKSLPHVIGCFRFTTENPPLLPRYHGHLYELLFVIKGKGFFEINDSPMTIKAGDVLWILPSDRHRFTKGSTFEAISFHFSLPQKTASTGMKSALHHDSGNEFVSFMKKNFSKTSKMTLRRGSQVMNRVMHLFTEYHKPHLGSPYLVSLYALEIIVLLARNQMSNTEIDMPSVAANERDRLIAIDIAKKLEQNLESSLDFEKMLGSYGLHRNYCRTIFKQIFGQSLTQYRLNARIGHAKELLRDTELPLTEIARKVGIDDYYYFLKAFKKVTGVPPGSLRKMARR